MQEKARSILKTGLVHGADPRFILPISTTIDDPMVQTNFQYEDSSVEIDGVKLKQHPYFRFLFVRKFRDKISVFNAKTWKWSTSIPLEIVFAFMETKDDWYIIDRLHVYNVKTNELNGRKYKGDSFDNYKLERFYHPTFTFAFIDFIGRQFIEHDGTIIPILEKSRRNVRFYHDGAWITINAARFNYECYTGKRTEQTIILKDNKITLDCYRLENLIPKDEVKLSADIKPHPKYSDYGYNGEVISLKTFSTIRSPTLSLYLKGNRIYYSRERFIYECLNNRLLNADEFIIDGKLCNSATLSFKLNDKMYYRTTNPSIYISDDDAFYAPWNKRMKILNGFINIGSKLSPNLIAIPLSDRELHKR